MVPHPVSYPDTVADGVQVHPSSIMAGLRSRRVHAPKKKSDYSYGIVNCMLIIIAWRAVRGSEKTYAMPGSGVGIVA